MSKLAEIVRGKIWPAWLIASVLSGMVLPAQAGWGAEGQSPEELPDEVAELISVDQAKELLERLNEAIRSRDPAPLVQHYRWSTDSLADGRPGYPRGNITCRPRKGPLGGGFIVIDSEADWRRLWEYDVSHAPAFQKEHFTPRDLRAIWLPSLWEHRIYIDNVFAFRVHDKKSQTKEDNTKNILYYSVQSRCEELEEAGFERAPEIEEWKKFATWVTESDCEYGDPGCGMTKRSVEKLVELARDAIVSGSWGKYLDNLESTPYYDEDGNLYYISINWNIHCDFKESRQHIESIEIQKQSVNKVWAFLLEQDKFFASLKKNLPTPEDVRVVTAGVWGGYVKFYAPESVSAERGWYAAVTGGWGTATLRTEVPCDRIRAEALK